MDLTRLGVYLCCPAKPARSDGEKIFSKSLAKVKRSCTFAPALRTKVQELKTRRHVHRHIGLTALLRAILKGAESKKEYVRIKP